MEKGHSFPKHAGFSGSHHTAKEHRPTVPGFERGQNMPDPDMQPTGSIDQQDGPAAMPVAQMKKGGLSHIKSHHKNYAHGGKVEHDEHPKHGNVHYDEHGFQMHKMCHGGKA
jgi:hypothetical protein